MRKLIGLGVSLVILAVLYWQIDIRTLGAALGRTRADWLAAALALVIPVTVLSAWRLTVLAPARLPLGESLRLILMASVLNMVLPSKMGDIAKAYAIAERGHLKGLPALSLVVFEKAWDMLSLLVFCVIGLVVTWNGGWLYGALALAVLAMLSVGLLLVCSAAAGHRVLAGIARVAPGKIGRKFGDLGESWSGTVGYFWSDRRRAASVIVVSLVTWLLHLVQIWLFIFALDARTPFVSNLALAPLALLIGLLPFTFAGVGTRDAALIVLYRPWLDAGTGAALGVLCILRYLLPAIAGLPLLGRYIGQVKGLERSGLERP